MAKTLRFLLILILLTLRSNAYAWWCSFSNNQQGWYLEGSMYCEGISIDVALEHEYCGWYRPQDPYCSNYVSCVDQTEQRSVACSEPNTIGFVNEARFYTCSTDTWSDWTISSNNCSPAPASCFESQEERTVACDSGYSGSISEIRLTTCSTPYSDPETGPWIQTTNTCTLEATDITNPVSVVNPASPVNPLNNMVDPVGSMDTTLQQNVSPVEETMINTQEEQVDQKSTTTPSTSASTEVKEEQPKEKEESKQKSEEKESKIDKKDGFEIIPGFGIGLSLSLMQQSVDIQQIELTNILNLEQEQTYAREQDLLLNLIQSDDYTNTFGTRALDIWRNLLHDNPLQQDAFGD